MESTDAGTASRLSSETIPAAAYCAIMRPESTPTSCARNGGRPWLRAGSRARSVRRSEIDATSATAMARKSSTYADRCAVEVAVGLDPAVVGDDGVVDGRRRARARRRARRSPRCRAPRRAPAARSAASTRPAPGADSGLAVRRDDRRVRQERAQVRSRCRLPDLRAQRHAGRPRTRHPCQLALDRHRGGDVGRVEQQPTGRAGRAAACRACRRCR